MHVCLFEAIGRWWETSGAGLHHRSRSSRTLHLCVCSSIRLAAMGVCFCILSMGQKRVALCSRHWGQFNQPHKKMLSLGDDQIARNGSFFPTLQEGYPAHQAAREELRQYLAFTEHLVPPGQEETLAFQAMCPTIRVRFIQHRQWLPKKSICKTKDSVLPEKLRAQSNFKWCRELSNEFRCLPGQTVLGSQLD